MHPSSSRAFQRHQGHNLKHPGLVDLITTKQNKLPSFIDRFVYNVQMIDFWDKFMLAEEFKMTW